MGRKKIKRIKKNKKKLVEKKPVSQSAYKTGDEKIPIKKIKKQATEKRIYNVKDHVVYPKHGVGKIVAVEKAKITAGRTLRKKLIGDNRPITVIIIPYTTIP